VDREEENETVNVEVFEIQRTIQADPAKIFAVLCDPRGHVSIDSTGMLQSADGEPARAVGDSFTIHMDRESLNDYPLGRYDVIVTIESFIPDREISWSIRGVTHASLGHVYGYRLEPAEDGTLVTSFYDWSRCSVEWKESGVFPVISEGALRATLGVLARTVESP
jgi:hypothetical protein